MLARDLRSGRLIAVPANHVFASPPGGYHLGSYAPTLAHRVGNVPGFGHYGAPPAQIIYDGLGHPLGLSFLTALPALAGRVAALLSRVTVSFHHRRTSDGEGRNVGPYNPIIAA